MSEDRKAVKATFIKEDYQALQEIKKVKGISTDSGIVERIVQEYIMRHNIKKEQTN